MNDFISHALTVMNTKLQRHLFHTPHMVRKYLIKCTIGLVDKDLQKNVRKEIKQLNTKDLQNNYLIGLCKDILALKVDSVIFESSAKELAEYVLQREKSLNTVTTIIYK